MCTSTMDNNTLFKNYLRKRGMEMITQGEEAEKRFKEEAEQEEDIISVVVAENAEGKNPPAKKRGRPYKNKIDDQKDWTEEEVFKLIDLWSTKECLFKTSSSNYFNRNLRSKALQSICNILKENDVVVNPKQVQEKMNKLRNYYGAENRKTQSSKSRSKGTDDVYISTWKFCDSLDFLRDSLTVRQTISNLEDPEESSSATPSLYNVDNPPSAKSVRELGSKQKSNTERVMESTTKAMERINSKYQENPITESDRFDEDRSFTDMIYTMLRAIPDTADKAMLKLEIQQKIVQLKYARSNQPSAYLVGMPQANQSQPMYFGISSPSSSRSSTLSSPPPPFRPF